MSASHRAWIAAAVGALTLLYCAAPELRINEHLDVRVHHLVHALILLGGVATGLLAAAAGRRHDGEHPLWLIPAVLTPSLAMLLMWPSTYEYLEHHPLLHFVNHVVFASLGALTAYSGERYWRKIGWAAGMALVLTGFLAAGGFGLVH